MAHAQKSDFVLRWNGWVHLNRRGCQFSRLLAAEVCASAIIMLDTPCSKMMWRVLATYSIRQFPLHFPSRVSLCAITFQLDSTEWCTVSLLWNHEQKNHEIMLVHCSCCELYCVIWFRSNTFIIFCTPVCDIIIIRVCRRHIVISWDQVQWNSCPSLPCVLACIIANFFWSQKITFKDGI